MGTDDRRIAGDDDNERGCVVESETPSPGSTTPRGRRWGSSCSAQFAGRCPQRFFFAHSGSTTSGDHRLRGGVPPSGDLSVEGTCRGGGTRVLRPKSSGDVEAVRDHCIKGSQGS